MLQSRAEKDLRKLDRAVQRRVVAAIQRLAETEQGDVARLTDVDPPEWRLRVGDWRVRFAFEPGARVLRVLRVLPRGEVYR